MSRIVQRWVVLLVLVASLVATLPPPGAVAQGAFGDRVDAASPVVARQYQALQDTAPLRMVSPQVTMLVNTFPAQPAASLAFDLTGTWQTRAWSTTEPAGAPAQDGSGTITIQQDGNTFTGTFVVETHVPPSTGVINSGTIDEQGNVNFSYTVTAGSPLYVGRTQTVVAQVQPDGTMIAGTWSESSGYAGEYRAFNQQVPARPVAQTFGQPCADVCGRRYGNGFDLDPVNLATGNFTWAETDLVVAAPGLPLVWSRTYNSRDTRLGIFGRGWSGSFDGRLDLGTAGQVTVITENGGQSVYRISGSNYLRPQGESAELFHDADGTYRLVRPDQSVLHFSSTGQLLSKIDTAGRSITLSYTGSALSSITDSAGRSFAVATDAQGRVTQITDARTSPARTVIYSYTGDLLTSVTDLTGQVTTYGYTNDLLTSIRLPGGEILVANQYDAQGRLTWQDARESTPFTVTYDVAAPAISETITFDGGRTSTVNHTVTRTIVQDSAGHQTTYDHDTAGRLLRLIDANGKITLYTVNGNDDPVQVKNPLGQVAQQTFDARGNLLTERDATGVGFDYAYDSVNRLVAERDTLGRVTAYSYTPEGLLGQATDPLGGTTTYTYSAIALTAGGSALLLTAIEDAEGRVTHYAYNGLGQVTTITNALNQDTTLEYDAAGRLVKTTDPGGVAECREYDAAGRLTAVVANCKPGQPATAEQNVRTEYGYDVQGRPAWTRAPSGEVTRTVQGSNGRVERTVLGCAQGGVPSTATCDPFNAATPEFNRVTTFGYDDWGRQVTATDALGIVTQTRYDVLGRPTRTTRNYVAGALGNGQTNVTEDTIYDAAGRVTATNDPRGLWTDYRYDAAGRRTQTIENYIDGDPTNGATSDRITSVEYNEVGLPQARIANYVDGSFDPAKPDEDVKTVTLYDDLDRPVAVIEAYVDGVASPSEIATDRITEYQYDKVGNTTAVTDPLGHTTVTVYDALNRPVEEIRNCTDGAGAPRTTGCAAGHGARNDENFRSTMSYTARGALELHTDPLGRRTLMRYDGLGRVTEQVANESGTVAPANVSTLFAYNAAGQTTSTTDAANQVWQREYNAAGWLTQQIDPTGRAVRFTYDVLGRQTARIDALGHETHTLYDALGRPAQTIVNWQNGVAEPTDGPDTDLITFIEYNVMGQESFVIDPAGRNTAYNYDSFNRLVGVVANAQGSVAPVSVGTSYAYDRLDRLTTITDAEGRQQHRGYNTAGWQTSATDGLNRTTTYAYDRAGRKVGVSDPRPVTVTYTYDGQGRLTGITAPTLTTVSMTYDLADRRTGMTDETGTTTYSYDGLDRQTAATQSMTGVVTTSWDDVGRRTGLATSTGAPALTYTYDAAGRPLAVQRAGALYAQASYDAAGRLEQVARAGGPTTTYAYDGADRLTGLTTTQGGATLAQFGYTLARDGLVTTASENVGGTARTVSYSYDGLRRLTGAAEAPGATYGYSYDNVGNRLSVTKDGTTVANRTYDAADQVVGWTYDGAGNLLSDGTNTYAYDPLGRLSSVTTGSAATTYQYTGDGVLAAQTAGGATTRYTLDTTGGLPERLGATTGATTTWYVRGYGQELAREAGGTTSWYLTDRLGSVRAESGASGTLTATYTYDPFGTPEGTSTPTDYGFTGEPQDAAAGLVQLRARWYQPTTGTFTSRDAYDGDPETPATFAAYPYAHNDPVNGTDPTGEYLWRLGDFPYHQLIELAYLAQHNPNLVHVEYDDQRNSTTNKPIIIVDLLVLNSSQPPTRGDVFEIEPIAPPQKEAEGLIQAKGYVSLLSLFGWGRRLNGYYTGYPKGSIPSIPYNWNSASWQMGDPLLFPPMRLSNLPTAWGSFADLVAVSPTPGLILYWLEPRQPLYGPAWDTFKRSIPNKQLARPYQWRLGQPITPKPAPATQPQPAPAAPPSVFPVFPVLPARPAYPGPSNPSVAPLPYVPGPGGGGGLFAPDSFPSHPSPLCEVPNILISGEIGYL